MFQKNFYKGKKDRCFILATGPSLSEVDLSLLENEITIGVNAIQKSGYVTDYIVVSDAETVERDVDIIMNEQESIKHFVFGESPSNRIKNKTTEKMKIFKNVSVVYNKEKEDIKMPPMHERPIELCRKRYYIDSNLKNFSTYGGSVVQDLTIPTAIYLGFKEIYLLGCDGGFRHFYADTEDLEDSSALKWIDRYGDKRPGYSFVVVKEILDKMGVKLYNCSPSDNFKELEYIKLNEVIGE